MSNLILKVIGYIFLRSLVFFVALPIIDKNVKLVKGSDLENKEDWLMFLWLFLVPIIIEIIILFFPFSYGLSKVDKSHNKSLFYLFFLILFFIEFALTHWLVGIRYPLLKVGISLFLFLLLFRKRLFS
jgi:hypothetical protein